MATGPASAIRFKAGDEVYAKENPQLPLVVRRYLNRIYYCRLRDNDGHKEVVYFDRELLDSRAD